MQSILTEQASILETVKKEVLDNIGSTSRWTREKAIYILTSSLDPKSEKDNAIFQTIPLELLERGDHLWAIWYIETIGRLWNSISLEVVEKVIEWIISERKMCIEVGNQEALHALDMSLVSFIRMAKNHTSLKDSSRFHLLIWWFEEVRWNHQWAISHYTEAIERQEIQWYFSLARVYDDLGQYDKCIILLERGYTLHWDIRLLWVSVRMLCKANKIADARKKHELLKSMDESTPPFIIYSGSIENDEDLWTVESIIASYITENTFVPSESLAELARWSSDYIKIHIISINERVKELSKKEVSNWTNAESTEYSQLIFRRLRLMQVDILTLWNDTYTTYYLRDLKKLWIEWTSKTKDLLRNFFIEHYSEEVRQYLEMRDASEDSDNEDDMDKSKHSLFDDISEHINRVGDLFNHPKYYDIIATQIMPLLQQLEKIEWYYDDASESEFIEELWEVKETTDFFDSMRPSVRQSYEFLLQEIDDKYWVFYRRHLQVLANDDPDLEDELVPLALKDYSDIALLYWIQRIISKTFPTIDFDEIDNIVIDYSLHKENISNALLFGSMIYEVLIEYSLQFLTEYPNMLDIPEALYLITEILRSIDRVDSKEEIRKLDILVKQHYNAPGFFDHIRNTFERIYQSDPSDEDIEYMLLTNWNIVILQDKDRTQAIQNFETAGKMYGSVEGLLQAGDSYEDMGQYDRALEFFIQAFNKDNSIKSLTKILNCTICSGQFEIAERYIQYWLFRWFNIEEYILAFHLWQWNTHSAYLQVIRMMKQDQDIFDRPEWLPNLLFDSMRDIINSPESIDFENNKLKILASFIRITFYVNWIPEKPWVFVAYWQYMNTIFEKYEWESLHSFIENTLSPITWELDMEIKEVLSPSDQSLEYLDAHASKLYATLKERLNEVNEAEMLWEIEEWMNELSYFVIVTLRRFPDSEKYITKWQSKIRFRNSIDTKRTAHKTAYTLTYH